MSMYVRARTPEFFKDCIHEAGKLLYTTDEKGNIAKVYYFSGTRTVIYDGEITNDLKLILTALGKHVSKVEFDEVTKTLKVIE